MTVVMTAIERDEFAVRFALGKFLPHREGNDMIVCAVLDQDRSREFEFLCMGATNHKPPTTNHMQSHLDNNNRATNIQNSIVVYQPTF